MNEQASVRRGRGRPRVQKTEISTGTVKALDRGLLLLRAMMSKPDATLTELALHVGMPPPTAHRLLSTLEQHGFVQFNPQTQVWSIGLEAFRVGSAYLERTNLVASARVIMRQLTEETSETANLAIADQSDVVFINQVETHNPIRAFFSPGTRGYMHATGIGKALLAMMRHSEVEKILQKTGCPAFTPKTLTSPSALFAELAVTRARGWSYDDEERYMGMRCIAACIYNAYGEAIAGISVSGPAVRFPDEAIADIAPKVMRAAEQVTTVMGGKVPDKSIDTA